MENQNDTNEFEDIFNKGSNTQTQENKSDTSSSIAPTPNTQLAQKENENSENEFENILGGKSEKFVETSEFGAAARHAIGGVIPAAGTLIGAGTGGAAGALAGGVGAFGGALAGGIGGGYAAEHFQDWLLSKVPENWVEALGQSKDQKMLDEMMHPNSSFVGGMVPFTFALSPTAGAAKVAEEGLTTFQKLLTNPVSSRVMSGALMGGFEAGQEVLQGEAPDWRKVSISTGFGLVFNGSNRIGETLHGIGRSPLIRPTEYIAGKFRGSPTLASLSDENIIGPGVTLEVMNGTEKRNPVAEKSARDNYYKEYKVLGGESAAENIHEIAKRQNPEVIERYEALQNDRSILEEWRREHEEEGNLSEEDRKWVDENIEKSDKYIQALEPLRTQAYKNAAARVPSALIEEGVNPADVSPEVQQKISPPNRPIEEQRKFISEDISKRLEALGKPKEEATTQADLQAKYYAMRAYRFEGKRGTAEEFYRSENPGLAKHVEGLTHQDKSKILNPEQLEYKQKPGPVQLWEDFAHKKTYAENREGWTPGDIVTNKDLKNLLVSKKFDTGEIELLGKPGKDGKSSSYLYDKEGKITKSAEKVNFEDETKHIQAKEPEEALEQRKTKKDKANGYIERLISGVRSVIYLAEHSNPTTFMHEMGHQWLIDLFNDAQHPLAPEALKNDAKMVADQLKIKDFADLKNINRNQHEQFARWVEQYLREGISPSRELDGLFAKFRDWFLSVYETLKELGKPITPEIRGVLDRMLSEAPEPRVIVPEKPRGPTLSEIHEADAEHAVPHPEAPEADRIDHEVNRFIQDQPQEVKDEINEAYRKISGALEPKPEAGERAGEFEEVASSDELAGLIPEGEAGSKRGGAFHQVGEQNKEEIYRSLSGESNERISAGGIDDIAPILDENRDWSALKKYRTEVNPALENLTNDEDLKNFLDFNEKNNNEFDAFRKRTPISPGDALNWADDFGMAERDMKKMLEQSRIVSENAVAAKNLLKNATYRMKTMIDKWAETRDPKDALDAYAALQSQTMIQGYYMGFRSNAGRFLGNFRRVKAGLTNPENISTFLKDSAGMTLFQVEEALERALLARNLPEMSRYAREEAQPVKWGTAVHEAYSNWLRSSIYNQAINAMSQTFDVAYSYTLVKPVSAGVGKIASLLGQTGERRRLSELSVPFKELAKPTHYNVAKETFLTGNQLELPGENISGAKKDIFDMNAPNIVPTVKVKENVTWKELFSRAKKELPKQTPATEKEVALAGTALLQSGAESLINAPENLQLQRINKNAKMFEVVRNPRGVIPDLRIGGVNIPLGSAIRAPGERIDLPQSHFFASHTAISEKNMWSTRTAQEIAERDNLTDVQRNKIAADLMQNPPPDKVKEFNEAARNMIYMGGSGKVSDVFTKFIDFEVGQTGLKPLRFVVPFAKITFQIANKAFMEGSVAGIASERVRNNLLGKNGNIAQHDAISKMAVGTTLYGLFTWYAMSGNITGSGPQDFNERQAWMAAGNQPYSLRIGSNWYSYGSFGPLAKIMGMSADLYDIGHHISEMDIATGMKRISYAAGSLFLDESPFGALSNLMKAINDPSGKGTKLIASILSNFVPFSSALRAVTKTIDPHMKDAQTFMQSLIRGVPGLSTYVPNKLDVWGREIGFSHQASNDPIIAYPASVGFGIGYPEKKIKDVELTQKQYLDSVRITGQTAYSQLQRIVGTPKWNAMSAIQKHDAYSEVFKRARNAAAAQILRNNPEIIVEAKRIKREKKLGKEGETK